MSVIFIHLSTCLILIWKIFGRYGFHDLLFLPSQLSQISFDLFGRKSEAPRTSSQANDASGFSVSLVFPFVFIVKVIRLHNNLVTYQYLFNKNTDYNGFRGDLNQKSIPSKTTEGRRGAAEGRRGAAEGRRGAIFSVPPLRFSVTVRAYSQGSPKTVIISKNTS